MLTVDYRSLSTVSVLIIPLCLLPSDLELPQPKVSKGFTTASTTLALVTLSFLLAVSFLDTGRHSCSSTLGVASPSSSWASLCLPFSLSLWVCSIKFFTFFFSLSHNEFAGFGYDKLTATPAATKGFVVLYCFANYFQNFGPNVTTFVIPGEIFPTRYRSTAHGISAASGKLGAIVAQVGFSQLVNIGGTNKFVKHMYVFSSSIH